MFESGKIQKKEGPAYIHVFIDLSKLLQILTMGKEYEIDKKKRLISPWVISGYY
jgi:hypothetical protein